MPKQTKNKLTLGLQNRYGSVYAGREKGANYVKFLLSNFYRFHPQSAIFSNFCGRYIAFLKLTVYSWAWTLVPIIFFKLAILVFSAFGNRDLAKQVTLKERLSGNLNTFPNTAFLTAWPWWRSPSRECGPLPPPILRNLCLWFWTYSRGSLKKNCSR